MEKFEDIIETYHPIVFKISRVYTDNNFDFNDLYQEVLIQLWKSYKKFKGDSKWSTFIYRVALNTSLNYVKSDRRNKSRFTSEPIPESIVLAKNELEVSEDTSMLYKAINQLRKDESAIILLFLDELSYDEIAQITGITISNVGVKISRIKKKLYKSLKEAGYERG